MAEYIEFATEDSEIRALHREIRRLERDLEHVQLDNLRLQTLLERCQTQTLGGREFASVYPATSYDRMRRRGYGSRGRTKRRKRKGKKSRRRKR